MAIKQEMRTFKNIVDQIMALMKYQSTDTVSRDRIKADVQRAYLTEVMPFHEWPWLRNKITVQHKEYFGTGTASVTQNSVTVTLTETLTASRAGYLFSINGQNETYRIRSHTAGSTTLVLDTPYISSTNSAVSFKIWKDTVPLPSEAMQILQVTYPGYPKPLDGVGLQEITRYAALGPKAEGKPRYYTLTDAIDPEPYSTITSLPASATRASAGLVKTIKFNGTLGSSASNLLLQVGDRIQISSAGNYDYNIEAIVSSVSTTTVTNDTITYTGLDVRSESSTADTGIVVKKLNTESYEKQKHLQVYPSLSNTATLLAVDYLREIEPLVDDNDEPVIPLADRIVLFWYGLSYSYSRERNPEEAIMYRTLAEQRIARMAGNLNESVDKPILIPSKLYLNTKRNPSKLRRSGVESVNFGGGGTTNPLGTPSQVAVFGTDGTLQSSATISTTELGALNGIVGNIETRLNALGLPSGSTGNKVLVTDSTPAIVESSVSSSSLLYLLNTESLQTVTLVDNTGSATNVATWDSTLYTSIHIEYSIKRGSAIESGTIVLSSDGSSVAMAQGGIASLSSTGATLTADLSAGSIRLRYTTTSTGSDATMKYVVKKWLA
jgi:hypothetical protein